MDRLAKPTRELEGEGLVMVVVVLGLGFPVSIVPANLRQLTLFSISPFLNVASSSQVP